MEIRFYTTWVCLRNVWKVMSCGSNFVLAWKWSMNMKCEYVWNAVFPTHTFQCRCIIYLSEGRIYTIFRIHTCHELLISNSKCRWYRISANVKRFKLLFWLHSLAPNKGTFYVYLEDRTFRLWLWIHIGNDIQILQINQCRNWNGATSTKYARTRVKTDL